MANAKRKAKPEPAGPLKLDLGCGKNPREGFIGVDSRPFGQQIVLDLVKRRKGVEQYHTLGAPESDGYDLFEKWPWKDNSVTEAHASHFVEHLTGPERVHFANELHRVLKPDGKATVIVPHWASPRAYGDVTHQWPPVSEWWFLYLNKGWRDVNAPHNDGYTCHFEITYGYAMRGDIAQRSQEYQQYALQNYKDAAQDIISTWIAKK